MKFRAATHDIGLHFLVIFIPYQWWLKIHEQNAIWAGLTPESERGSWRSVPLERGCVKSWWRAAIHDTCIHPLSVVFPFRVWARLHNRNAIWAFGAIELDRDPNPVPEQ